MNNASIIRLFEENELNISVLYSLYAQKIAGKQKFWNKLSDEEISHAAEIGTNKKYADEQSIQENKFSRGVIRYVMDYVLEEIKKAQKKDRLNHDEALLNALRIERSMLEKKCFNMFKPADKTVADVLKKINSDTEKHIEVLMKEIENQK